MAETYKAEDILHTYAESWGLGEDHPDYPEYLNECAQIETALQILENAPSAWLSRSIRMLAEEIPNSTVFFSADGKTALIMDERDGNTLLVRLTKDQYATGGGKIFWATANNSDFWVAKQ